MLAKRYADLFAKYPLDRLMKNVSAHVENYTLDGVTIPTTIVDDIRTNCYTVSPYAMLIGYGHDELVKLPRLLRPPLVLFLRALSAYLHRAEFDKVQTLNNFCLSTNILSKNFQALDIKSLTEIAIKARPEYALLIRSVNDKQHGELMAKLKGAGWAFIASRQVYLVNDMAKALKKEDSRRDLKLLKDARYRFYAPVTLHDYEDVEHWYNQLYLNKYSEQNVQFTAQGLQALHAENILDLYLLYDEELKRSVGIIGMVSDDDYMTAPILGYDIERPIKEALYRRLVVFSLDKCHQQGKWLNQSAGAPQFKRNRGAQAEIEYTAVYTAHLPKRRARIWGVLAWLSPFYVRMLRHWKL